MAQHGQQIGQAQRPEGELRSGAAALGKTIIEINERLAELEQRLYQPTPRPAASAETAPPPGLPSIEVALNRANQGLDIINGRLATVLERL